jgi:polyisoprenoid-binding protein YceI
MKRHSLFRLSLTTLLGTVLCCLLPSAGLSDSAEPTAAPAPPGSIRFMGKNLIAKGDGTFSSWRFKKFEVDPNDVGQSEVVVEIDIASIDTDSAKRDEHLQADDFFDVAKYPTAAVRVFNAVPVADSPNSYTASFEITIRDITKTIDGTFDLMLGPPARVEGKLVLDRTDFGIGAPYSAFNPLSIKEQIPIEFSAERDLESK